MPEQHRICTYCVMDDSDPDIQFDEQGRCHHCRRAAATLKEQWYADSYGQQLLHKAINHIRLEGRRRPYDCVIGVSGGVDSSYVVCQAKDYGLRTLLLHIDGGWNTPEAEHNLRALSRYTGFPLESIAVDWDEMRDLQVAFLRSGVPNQDIPQDHAFFAGLVDICLKRDIRYFLSGNNLASESILPPAWGYLALDEFHLTSIHRLFGQRPLRTFPLMSLERLLIYNGCGYGLEGRLARIAPLNLMPYNPSDARQFLMATCGWQDYGRKHGESIFTKFFQNHYLPEKFGFDKRKAHLSSLIAAGHLTREEALTELAKPLYDQEELEADRTFVLERLGLSKAQWDEIMAEPTRSHADYPHQGRVLHHILGLYRQKERRRNKAAYIKGKIQKLLRRLSF